MRFAGAGTIGTVAQYVVLIVLVQPAGIAANQRKLAQAQLALAGTGYAVGCGPPGGLLPAH